MPDREKYEEPVRVSITRRPTAIFSRLGFALLLVATALYLAHVDSRLGPPIRVGLGVVVSIFLCFLGQWLEKRTKIFGQVVFAVGLGFAYFLAFGVSSFDLLKLFDSFYGGLAVQAGVAAVAIYIAAKKRNENLAGFWIFLAYLSCASSFFPSVTPLIWENARLVLGAGLVLGLAMFVLIWLRAWTRLPFLGVLCVYGLHSVWLLYAGISETANGVSAQTVFDQNFAFLVLYTAVFHGMAILLSFSPSRARSLLIFNHAAVLGLLVLQCACWTISGRPASMALAGLGLAILVSTIIFWRLRSLRPLAGIQLIVTGVFLAAAAVYSATPLNAAAAWAVIGLLVLICGLQGLGSISIVAGGVMTALSSLLAVSWPWIRPLILGDTPGVGGIFNMTPQEAGAITQLVQTSGPSAVAVGATAIAHRLCADKRERAFAELGENRFVWTERLLFIAFVVHLLAVWVYHFTSVDLPFIASLIGVVILFCGHRRIASLGYIAIALSLWYHVLMFFAVGLPKAGLWQSSPLQIAIRQLAPVTLPTSGLLGSVLLASGAMVVDAIRVRVTGLDKAQTGQGKFGLIVACLGVGMASVVAGMTFSAAWWIWFPVLVGVMLLVATFIAGRMEFAYGGVFAWFGAHVLSWVFSFSSADGNLGGYSIQGLGLWALFGVSVLVCLWGRRRARFDTVFADLLSPSLLLELVCLVSCSSRRSPIWPCDCSGLPRAG